MKMLWFATVALLTLMLGTPDAFAKCFAFKKSDAVVCIDGNDNATRKQAEGVCKDATGKACGGITGYSGECRTSGDKVCYDGKGKQQKYIKAK